MSALSENCIRGYPDYRKHGALYVESLSHKAFGVTQILEKHGVDPPHLSVSHFGQSIALRHDPAADTWNLHWFLKAKHYPYVADFLGEVSQHGCSRAIAKELHAVDPHTGKTRYAANVLTTASRLLVAHPHAFLLNWGEYRVKFMMGNKSYPPWNCDKPGHQPDSCQEPCVRLLAYDLGAGDPVATGCCDRQRQRTLPSGQTYQAHLRPPGVEPLYAGMAYFLSLPIQCLSIIDPEGKHNAFVSKERPLPVIVRQS